MPRSGTTWLGRLLGGAPSTALVGREPMNPHAGQYRLGGTLTGWASLDSFSSKQLRSVRTAYWGVNPFVFGRYGRRQWSAPAPWTRVVVKDPFAMLSLPAISQATGAVVVLLYRHPGAALASYRRMGWHPDLDELHPLLQAHRACRAGAMASDSSGARPADPGLLSPDHAVTAEQMAQFWSGLYEIAMDQVDRMQDADVVVVSHEELAGGGIAAARRLFDRLGLSLGARSVAELQRAPAPETTTHRTSADERLHNFNRSSVVVAHEWRSGLDAAEIATVERLTRASLRRVVRATLNVS